VGLIYLVIPIEACETLTGLLDPIRFRSYLRIRGQVQQNLSIEPTFTTDGKPYFILLNEQTTFSCLTTKLLFGPLSLNYPRSPFLAMTVFD